MVLTSCISALCVLVNISACGDQSWLVWLDLVGRVRGTVVSCNSGLTMPVRVQPPPFHLPFA